MQKVLSAQEQVNSIHQRWTGQVLPIPTDNYVGSRMREKMLTVGSFSLKEHCFWQNSHSYFSLSSSSGNPIILMSENLTMSPRSFSLSSFFFIFLSSPALSWRFFFFFYSFFHLLKSVIEEPSTDFFISAIVLLCFSSLYWSSALLHTPFSCFSLSSPWFPSAFWAY